MTRVLVGLSGGVDSSAVVDELVAGGHEVVACVLRMQEGGAPVPAPDALDRARSLCAERGVKLVEEDVSARFACAVVEPFVGEYARGRTPNPCVTCNAAVKFSGLLAAADRFGCEKVATGHYAGTVPDGPGRALITRGADAAKDQSYFLYRLAPHQTARLWFPLAARTKDATRAYAREHALAAAEAKDSTGVCFAPGGDYHATVSERAPGLLAPGPIVTEDGTCLGEHRGIACYTLGQRKGLGLSGGPWFITRIDPESNTVTVAHGTPPRWRSFSLSDAVLWRDLPAGGLDCMAQAHYRARAVPAHVTREGKRLKVELAEGDTLAASGQSCVLYRGATVIGGGIIELDDCQGRSQ